MNLQKELFFAIGSLVVLNLVLAFGAIGLFMRMGPAIELILQENVHSIVAAEEILTELANTDRDEPLGGAQRATITEALAAAEKNITEAEERPVLQELRQQWSSVAEGQADAREEFVAGVQRLILINRNAMAEVDAGAKQLGRAGAWAAVLIGVSTFLLSMIVLSRLQRRFVDPLLELHVVLNEAQRGQRLRRCRDVVDAPRELRHLSQAVNQLLDERLGNEHPSEEHH